MKQRNSNGNNFSPIQLRISILTIVISFLGAAIGGLLSTIVGNSFERQQDLYTKRSSAIERMFSPIEGESAEYALTSFTNHLNYATYASKNSLEEASAKLRNYRPDECNNKLSKDCKLVYVKWVNILRKDIGLRPVSEDDLLIFFQRDFQLLEEEIKQNS